MTILNADNSLDLVMVLINIVDEHKANSRQWTLDSDLGSVLWLKSEAPASLESEIMEFAGKNGFEPMDRKPVGEWVKSYWAVHKSFGMSEFVISISTLDVDGEELGSVGRCFHVSYELN